MRVNVSLASSLDPLEEVFRTDTGVPPEEYAADVAAGASTMNRPAYVSHLHGPLHPGIPELHIRVQT